MIDDDDWKAALAILKRHVPPENILGGHVDAVIEALRSVQNSAPAATDSLQIMQTQAEEIRALRSSLQSRTTGLEAHREAPADPPTGPVAEFARLNQVKAATIRSRISKYGSYFGIVPRKYSNGRTDYPLIRVQRGVDLPREFRDATETSPMTKSASEDAPKLGKRGMRLQQAREQARSSLSKVVKNFDQLPDLARIRDYDVAALEGVSKSTIWRWVALGRYPPPERMCGTTRWTAGAIRAHHARKGK